MKTSKVKSVQGAGTFESQYGMLFKFEYEMEDGQVITANHKKDKPLDVGSEVDYEVKTQFKGIDHGKVRLHQDTPPAFSNGGNKQSNNNNNTSFAMSYSKDIVCACINNGIITSSKEIEVTLKKFYMNIKTEMDGSD